MSKLTGTGSRASFEPLDWLLVVIVGVTWGSAYLWIAIGLEALAPSVIACLRVALGAAALFAFPAARRRIDTRDWPYVTIVAIAGNGGPALLFALAEERLDSAVVGMLVAAAPVLTLVLAFSLGNRHVRTVHVAGIGLGFVGVVAMAAPELGGADASVLGIALTLTAVLGYALTGNVVVPLQQRYGSMAVVANAQALSAVVLFPLALGGLAESTLAAGPILAVVFLGVMGTGVARALSATLAGRAGPQRSGVPGYLAPVVAIILGVAIRDESVDPIQIAGLVLVLIGAFLIARPNPEFAKSRPTE